MLGLAMHAALPHMSVLVVDDDDVDRERVLRILRHAPLDVDATEATSGAQALEFVKDRSFDFIVLDNQLGDVLGTEILPVLMRGSLQACPVIMVTGEGDEQLAVRAMQQGAADYVPKRYMSADVMLHSVRHSLEQHRLREELARAHRQLEHHVREQKRTIEQRERDLKSILDHMPALIGYWDTTLHNRFGNRAHQEWYGLSSERMPGMHLREVAGETGWRVVEPYVEAALGGREQKFEYTIPLQGGQAMRYGEAHLIPDWGSSGSIDGFYSFVTDVTAVKQAQARASELAAFNEAVIQSSPVGIAVYDADGRCMLANAALAAAVTTSQAALLKQDFRALSWWRESGLTKNAEAALVDGCPRRCEAHVAGCSDRQAWLECALVAIDRQGVRCLLLIAHDVTADRAAKAELATARDGANAAAQAKGNFVANMSHEIRTPMNAIVGLSRLALEDDLPPRARDYVDKVHSSALALMGILDDVLDYSKIEAGQLRFESVQFDLDDLLQRVADLFAARTEQKGLEFVFDVLPQVPTRLVGDPLRLSQVLCNLVGNAVKFTEQGEILVTVTLVELRSASVCRLQFSVHDTGVGIAPDSKPGLFDAFTQADSSITRRFGGSGLGLAICKRLVEQMDGEIDVYSTPGGGSEFSFTAELGVAESGSSIGERSEVASLQVLVVDDNRTCRRALANALQSLGIHSRTAQGGAAALRHLERAYRQERPFDAVLLDSKMPGMNGQHTLGRMQEQANRHGWHPVPVIMMGTKGECGPRMTSAGDIHPFHVLTKPVSHTQLLNVLLRLHRGQAAGASTGDVSIMEQLRTRACPLRGARVLVVEDNVVNQLVAGELLKLLGVEVTVVDDGLDALQAVRDGEAGCFDAVLMDLHMPRMDGFEATRRIQAMPHASSIPVIAMSAAVLPEDRAQSFAAGMVDHIAKPIVAEHLLEVLLKWLKPGKTPP